MIDILYIFVLLLPLVLYVLFWIYALKKGWRSIRLLAITVFISLLIFSVIIWLGVRETWILGLTIVSSIIISLSVLSWPLVAKDFVNKIHFKW
jgi:hypothetical protein